ncbi:dTDP-4-dehydrorhamnose reductase [Qipengyuania spongiae]|uniref:dTDP-4-dehydrorhamnose reductase n=1 Tax=Qipengyuania spongiae TaxID=2909673 RepID=A0ABY5T3Z9_9SPHN|nr:dTDP-4-dehydrorhamnose reductase [Qipengyuania spongiae]UVI40841.1 dTDP-4-dehydrorhamnose reductase [Qipengyuania spongiae]
MIRAVLVTGASGQLGIELGRACWPEGLVPVTMTRTQLNLDDPKAITGLVAGGHESSPFAAVINAAAYTAVDKAESEQTAAWRANALAPAAFGQACVAMGVPLIQVSTDYVFPGDRGGAWEVGDATDPINVYGASKLGGELAVRASGARHAIVRTAWVVSAHGHNFVKTMLRVGAEHETLSVVADQRGSPTAASDLAAALVTITARMASDPASPSGTYHFSNAGATDWAGFASEVFRQSAARGGPSAQVIPITTADYPTPARRPANSLLSHRAIEADYGIAPRPWTEALSDILDELIGEPTP